MKTPSMLYWLGVILFLLNIVAFALQGALFDGGLLLILALAVYMTSVYLYHGSEKLRMWAVLLSSSIGVAAIIFAAILYTNGGH